MEYVEAKIQVLAKPSTIYQLAQIPVGSGDDTYVDFSGLFAAERTHMLIFDHVQ